MSTPPTVRGSFAGHETFPFRYMWLRKAVQGVKSDEEIFRSDTAMISFGVGKNMVRSIRHWGLATEMIEETARKDNRGRYLQPSMLGRLLFVDGGWDPYMEDPATLWLLHWNLASSTDPSTTWYWVFNQVPQLEFSKQQLIGWLRRFIDLNNIKRVSPASLKRDVDCFIRTYVPSRASGKTITEDTLDCPLVELGLIREFGAKGNYLLERGEHPNLPDEVFAYGLICFLTELGVGPHTRTVPLDVVSFSPGSPGRVFCLSEDALLNRLERLDDVTSGMITYDDTAGLRQLMIHGDELDALPVIGSRYPESPDNERGGRSR